MMMLPGPPSRSNGGSMDCSSGGLVAYGAGSSVVVVDPRSMQLVCALPMPPSTNAYFSSSFSSSSSSGGEQANLASYVTSVRWKEKDLVLAAGDRQGRIAIWDVRGRRMIRWLSKDEGAGGGGGIQDMCWIKGSPNSNPNKWLLASIHGPSVLALWDYDDDEDSNNKSKSCCVWRYDASPEYLSCLRRDPFDGRHLCALGLRGLLLSAIPLSYNQTQSQSQHKSEASVEVSLKGHRVPGITSEQQQQQPEAAAPAPALVAFPLFLAKMSFSPLWRHILFLTFPKDLIVFDLHYAASLSISPLPRGCAKFMDVMPDPHLDLLYCLHLDGKLTIWKRKQ